MATASAAWATTRAPPGTSTSTSRRTPCTSRSRAATSAAGSPSRSPRCATTSCGARRVRPAHAAPGGVREVMLTDAVYVLPLRRSQVDADDVAELAAYLARVATVLPVVVADGSPPAVRAAHAAAWGSRAHVVPVPPPLPGTNGKVVGVLAGLAATTAERVVVADDDVRYDGAALARAVALLDHADVVVPQNVYDALPWHARWDTGRALLNRAFGGDFPGTLTLRRSALGPDGYDARVLFENLELMRTVQARGGRVRRALDLYVPRRPPTLRKFAEQRVRQGRR